MKGGEGVRSVPLQALAVFDDELRKAAQREGLSQTQALRRFMDGRLFSFGGGAPGLLRF